MTREEAIKKLHWFALDNRDKLIIDMAIEALSEPSGDLISRADAIKAVWKLEKEATEYVVDDTHEIHGYCTAIGVCVGELSALPSADAVQGWTPCNKQMPDELETVNVTWVNHLAPPYYKHIEEVPFVDSAVYYRGKWYWWDATVIDLLGEYNDAYVHGIEPIDKYIEITAWMQLPKPYREGGEEE